MDKLGPLIVVVAALSVIRVLWKKGRRVWLDGLHSKRMAELSRRIQQTSDSKEKAQTYSYRASYWSNERWCDCYPKNAEQRFCIDRGIEDYSKAIELDPLNADYYHFRGNLYSRLDDLETALTDYNRALQLCPHCTLFLARAEIRLQRKQYDLVIEDCTKGLELANPGSAGHEWLLERRADAFERIGMKLEASNDRQTAKQRKKQ